MAGPSPLDEWKQVHDALLDAEKRWADAAVQHARGLLSAEELTQQQQCVHALRELADTVFEAAFGVARRKPRGGA